MSDELPRYGSGIRGIFGWDRETGELVEVDKPKKLVAAPYVQTDTIEPTMSHATHEGRVFDSKSALRQHYKDNGYREVGNDRDRPEKEDLEKRFSEVRDDVERAMNDLKYGNAPLTEQEKETWRREQREREAYKKRNWHLS